MTACAIHIGRKAPKGWEELPGGIHLGKGIWILKIRPLSKKVSKRNINHRRNQTKD
jgi:hypothetical protein